MIKKITAWKNGKYFWISNKWHEVKKRNKFEKSYIKSIEIRSILNKNVYENKLIIKKLLKYVYIQVSYWYVPVCEHVPVCGHSFILFSIYVSND